MNRVTVIVLALALLLTHAFGIHQSHTGNIAAPYDRAHVAFRVGRNLAHAGEAQFQPGAPPVESYPSILWVGLCAAAEFRQISPILATRTLAILAALFAVVALAQFSTDRMAGLIAPMLLAASGSVAATGGSGTEHALVMSLVVLAVLAFERRARWWLASSLSLLVLARDEGIVVLAVLFAFDRIDRPRDEKGRRTEGLGRAWLLPLAALVLLHVYRRFSQGGFLSPTESAWGSFAPERWRVGAHYLASWLCSSGTAPLVVVPLLFLLGGTLAPVGRRALFVALAWITLVVIEGGDGLPFWIALAPALPAAFLAVQEAFTDWMDRRPAAEVSIWILLLLCTGAALLVSKTPSAIGPIPFEGTHRAWLSADRTLEEAFGRDLGRSGLAEEIREVESLRPLGLFLRDEVKDPAVIATFWPGAIGYLSRKHVVDLLGRATPSGAATGTRPWSGVSRLDLVDAFRQPFDYIVPALDGALVEATPLELLRRWLSLYDVGGDTDERVVELVEALSRYEMTSVPVKAEVEHVGEPPWSSFLLLRSKELGLSPVIALELVGDELVVSAHHKGHRQVVDLTISLTDAAGAAFTLRPTGELAPNAKAVARAAILLHPTNARPIQLFRGTIPRELGSVEITAKLHNPDTSSDAFLAQVGAAVSLTRPIDPTDTSK